MNRTHVTAKGDKAKVLGGVVPGLARLLRNQERRCAAPAYFPLCPGLTPGSNTTSPLRDCLERSRAYFLPADGSQSEFRNRPNAQGNGANQGHRLQSIVRANQERLLEAWHGHFGSSSR